MFTIEHGFDASTITLVDEGQPRLQDDVIINAFDDCITVTQMNRHTDRMQSITLSIRQARELAAALNLPEGVYSLPARK